MIEPVPLDTPYNLVLKDGNRDPQLNEAQGGFTKPEYCLYEESQHIPSPFNQVTNFPAQKTGMDACNEYQSLPLSPAAQDTTKLSLNTAGTSIFFVLSSYLMGQLDDITLDMIRRTRCIDHSQLWEDSIVEYITHCGKNRTVFYHDKLHFAENKVEVAGFLIAVRGEENN